MMLRSMVQLVSHRRSWPSVGCGRNKIVTARHTRHVSYPPCSATLLLLARMQMVKRLGILRASEALPQDNSTSSVPQKEQAAGLAGLRGKILT